ncbi:MAG: endonuclease/exonuclease/phosphatase family protein [Sphaerochaetaceae bacterium]|nr:endonuclease/exonuclease/phosphatase family protein [Sphaerochaetaceae bacterium]
MRVTTLCTILFTIFLTTSFSCSVADEQSAGDLIIISYNVQTLFDTVDDGDEFDGFSLAQGWSSSLYQERLHRVCAALIQYSPYHPDIIILQEVEGERVVEDLIDHDLGRRGFTFYASTSSSTSSIEVAIMSRYPILESHIHSVEGFRDILEAVIDVNGEAVRVYSLHLRSRREGELESEPERIAQIRALKGVMDRSSLTGRRLPTVIAGDFNQSADQHDRIQGAYQSALIPSDAPLRQQWEASGSLVITGSYPAFSTFYSFYLDERFPTVSEAEGSYHYDGLWLSYDQILLSTGFFDSAGYRFSDGGVITHPALLDDTGTPERYQVRNHTGTSDHLPVYVRLERVY